MNAFYSFKKREKTKRLQQMDDETPNEIKQLTGERTLSCMCSFSAFSPSFFSSDILKRNKAKIKKKIQLFDADYYTLHARGGGVLGCPVGVYRHLKLNNKKMNKGGERSTPETAVFSIILRFIS